MIGLIVLVVSLPLAILFVACVAIASEIEEVDE